MGISSNKYQISSEGVIFSIEDDGTIVRIARISEKGKIEPIRKHGKVDEEAISEATHLSLNFFLMFFLIIFAVATVILTVLWLDEKSDREKQTFEIEKLRNNSSQTELDLREAETKLAVSTQENKDLEVKLEICGKRLFNNPPKQEEPPQPKETETKIPTYEQDDGLFTITSIEVRNTTENPKNIISDFGERITSDSAKFLQLRIRYASYIYGQKVLDVKIFDANGHLRSGSNSKENYTYSAKDIDVFRTDAGSYLFKTSWGSSNTGFWPKGRTRIEIWSDGKFLKATEFEIY